MRYMKSASRLSPGPQFFAPPHDPDLRADVSGLLLQSRGRNMLLEHLILKWATKLVQIKVPLSLY